MKVSGIIKINCFFKLKAILLTPTSSWKFLMWDCVRVMCSDYRPASRGGETSRDTEYRQKSGEGSLPHSRYNSRPPTRSGSRPSTTDSLRQSIGGWLNFQSFRCNLGVAVEFQKSKIISLWPCLTAVAVNQMFALRLLTLSRSSVHFCGKIFNFSSTCCFLFGCVLDVFDVVPSVHKQQKVVPEKEVPATSSQTIRDKDLVE